MTEENTVEIPQEQQEMLNELFPGWEPKPFDEGEDIDFSKPIRGKYDVEVTDVVYKLVTTQEGDKDTIRIKCKVTNDISGDKSFNRFLDKTFWMGDSQWDEDPDAGLKQLINSVLSTGINFAITTKSDFEKIAQDLHEVLLGETVRVRAYPGRTGKQVVIFVKPKENEADTTGNPFV